MVASDKTVEDCRVMVNKDYFLCRCATWIRVENGRVTDDWDAPGAAVVEPNHQAVFLAADGEHTVQDLLDRFVGRPDRCGDAAAVREKLVGIVAELVRVGVIRLSERPEPMGWVPSSRLH